MNRMKLSVQLFVGQGGINGKLEVDAQGLVHLSISGRAMDVAELLSMGQPAILVLLEKAQKVESLK